MIKIRAAARWNIPRYTQQPAPFTEPKSRWDGSGSDLFGSPGAGSGKKKLSGSENLAH